MTLEEYCITLKEPVLVSIATELCEISLANWVNFCKHHKTDYNDSVTSMQHKVREELLPETINLAKQIQKPDHLETEVHTNKLRILLKEFKEHIVSLQDWDWHLPYETEKSFYAIYNLAKGFIDKKTDSETLIHYIAINQAIEAIEEGNLLTEDEIRKILYNNK